MAKTADLVKTLRRAAAEQDAISREPVQPAASNGQPVTEPPAAVIEQAAAAPEPIQNLNGVGAAPRPRQRKPKLAAEPERPTAERVRSMSLPELKQAYGVAVPDDDTPCQYTIRVPKWLRHVIQQKCLMFDLSSQDFGMMAIQLLLEELAGAEAG